MQCIIIVDGACANYGDVRSSAIGSIQCVADHLVQFRALQWRREFLHCSSHTWLLGLWARLTHTSARAPLFGRNFYGPQSGIFHQLQQIRDWFTPASKNSQRQTQNTDAHLQFDNDLSHHHQLID
jgi:hypothetical protein